MERQIWKGFLLGVILLCLWTLPIEAQTDLQKITVRVAGATIHAGPNAESQVIESPAVGSVYEVVRKTGEWYEIKLPSRLGMTITGFINEKFLNVEKPASEPQKSIAQTPARPVPKQSPRTKRGYVSLGGLYQRQKGYEYEGIFPYEYTTFAIYDSADDQNAFGFHLGGGFFVVENILEIDLGFRYTSATAEGICGTDYPIDPVSNVHAEAPTDHKFSEMMINLGLSFHLLMEGRVSPYLGGGISYVNGKVEMLKKPNFSTSTYKMNPELSSESINTLGFYGKAGMDIVVSDFVTVFGEGRYLLALKKEILQPFVGQFFNGETAEIDMGGISALFGVKIRF